MSTPFKNLDFFVEEDEGDFGGRGPDIHALVARIFGSRTTVLYGRSGLGKTSLLRAGLFPRLQERNFHCVYIRLLSSPLADLAAAVSRAFPRLPGVLAEGFEPHDRKASDLLDEALASLSSARGPSPRTGTLLLAFDQFEEFFTIFKDQPQKRRAFVQQLGDLMRDGNSDVRVVFSLREDYLYALDDFHRRTPDLFSSAYRLLPLTAFGAREALVRPLERRGIPYDDRLVTAILDALAPHEFESARLQLAAASAYRQVEAHLRRADPGSGKLRFELPDEDLERLRVPGTDDLFRRYLEDSLAQVPPGFEMDARTLLDLLITESETKLTLPDEDVYASNLGRPDYLERVLTELAASGLIRRPEYGGRRYNELRHECLIGKIRTWQKEHRGFADFLDARSAIMSYGRDLDFRDRPTRLLSSDLLQQAVTPNAGRLRLTATEIEYVLWSAIRHETDLAEWSRRWNLSGGRPIETLLEEMTWHAFEEVRKGAVAAVPLVAADSERLLNRCMDFLRTPASAGCEKVRRAALDTVATLGKLRGSERGGKLLEECLRLAEEPREPASLRTVALRHVVSSQFDDGLTSRFLTLALDESGGPELAELQSDAARAFAQRASVADLRTLRRSLRFTRTSERQLSLLANLYEAEHLSSSGTGQEPPALANPKRLASLGWWFRSKAREAWEQRAIRSAGAQLVGNLQAGKVYGLVAGLVWFLFFAMPVGWAWSRATPDDPGTFLLAWASFSLISAAVAGVNGARAAVCSVEAAALGQGMGWAAAARRSALTLWCIVLAIYPGWINLLNAYPVLGEWRVLLALAFAPSAFLTLRFCRVQWLVGALAGWGERVIRDSRQARVWVWALILNTALWLLPFALVVTVAQVLTQGGTESELRLAIWLLLWATSVGSAASFGWLVTLACIDVHARASSATSPLRSWRGSRLLAAVGAVTLAAILIWRHGGSGLPIPFFRRPWAVGAGPATAELGYWPDTAAFRVDSEEPLVRLTTSNNEYSPMVDSVPLSVHAKGESWIFLPRRQVQLVIANEDSRPGTMTWRLDPVSDVTRLDPAKTVDLLSTPLAAWVEFQHHGRGRWQADVKLQVTGRTGWAVGVMLNPKALWWDGEPGTNLRVAILDRGSSRDERPRVIIDEKELAIPTTSFLVDSKSEFEGDSFPEVEVWEGIAEMRFELQWLRPNANQRPRILVWLWPTPSRAADLREKAEMLMVSRPRAGEAPWIEQADLAWLDFLNGRFAAASERMRRAIDLRPPDPGFTTCKEIYGLAEYRLGHWEAAASMLTNRATLAENSASDNLLYDREGQRRLVELYRKDADRCLREGCEAGLK